MLYNPGTKPEEEASRPLCVDLDGTIIKSNTIFEVALVLIRSKPQLAVFLPFWFLRGQATLWRMLAVQAALEPSSLPYRMEVLDFLKRERLTGRQIILVTGSHESVAKSISGYVGLFDEVIATHHNIHLVGMSKLRALEERFGARGYDYLGADDDDLIPARLAHSAIFVNPTKRITEQLILMKVAVIELPCDSKPRLTELLRLMRVHQWAKNFLVFVPVVLGHRLTDLTVVNHALHYFLSFCFVSSATYILNDLIDIEADRKHQSKCRRPLAAGTVSIPVALLSQCCLLAAAAAFLIATDSASASMFLGVYVAATVGYSFWLKKVVIVDVVALAGLYCLRVLGGGAATGITVSPWAVAFSMFMFFSLALMKRYSELLNYEKRSLSGPQRRGYIVGDKLLVIALGIGSGLIAVLVIALYITSPDVVRLYSNPSILALICPLLLVWISRMWMLAGRALMDEDPVLFAIRDKSSWAIAAAAASVVAVAK